MHDKITIYYSKQTGKVKQYATGEHDMRFYGDDIVDFGLIYDFIIVDYDRFIETNFMHFVVVDGKLIYEQPSIAKRYSR